MTQLRTALLVVLLLACPAVAQDDDRLDRIRTYVDDYVAMAAFDGVVLIARGDEIVWQQTFGKASYEYDLPMTTDTVFRIGSLSKQITQGAIGRLVDQGKLSIDDTLDEFMPEFPNADRISLRQILDHTSGIAHTNQLDWMDVRLTMTLEEIVAALAEEPLLFSPGDGRQYSNGGYALLARVIEIASGQSYATFIEAEFATQGYASLGHETAYEVVVGMAGRYAPDAVYGQRVLADSYMTVNRIGGGSLYANAEDVFRFFLAAFTGELVSPGTTAALFPQPDDGDTQITGRSPGALAQVYMKFDEDLTVVTMSSNSAWPGSFNADISDIFRGGNPQVTQFRLSRQSVSDTELIAITGDFVADRFGWEVSIAVEDDHLVFIKDEIRTAFAPTTDGEFHVPIYDWLCVYGDYGMEFVCRQRDPDASIRFNFRRQ